MKSSSVFNKIFVGVICAVLCLYVISIFIPLVWGLITSLKSFIDFDIQGNVIGFPDPELSANEIRLSNYGLILSKFNFTKRVPFYVGDKLVTHESKVTIWTCILNTLLYSGIACVMLSVVPAVVAYICAKYDFAFMKFLYGYVVVTMIIPLVGTYAAEISLLRNLGIYDTTVGFILQKCSFSGMYFLVFYAFFKGLPDAYMEAADIDGASQFTVLTRIVLPLASKMIFSVMLIQFVIYWNDYQMAIMYMPTHPTLAYGIYHLTLESQSGEFAQYAKIVPVKVAGAMLLAIPIIILYVILKDKLMGNMSMGGLKG